MPEMSDGPQPRLRPSDPVQYAKGIGPVRAEALAEVGVETVEDLLYYFPRRYLDRRNIAAIADLKIGERTVVMARVVGQGLKTTRRRRYFQVTVTDETGVLVCVWFNGIEWIRNRFKVGDQLAIFGKVEYYKHLQMIHPECDLLGEDDETPQTGRILPLYPGTSGLKQKGLDSRRFRRVIQGCWERLVPVADHFSPGFRHKLGLPELTKALQQIHAPDDDAWVGKATHRLKFDEHFFQQLLMALRRRSLHTLPGRKFPERGPILTRIYRDLPFTLTRAQVRVMQEIRSDLQSGRMMNRLLQGDVGSGKTVVALLAAAIVAGQEAQVAIMAPTEILAEQHYRAFRALTTGVDLPLALLTGSTPRTERETLLADLQQGRILLVVGTHALIQEDVALKDLALLIVDEQHRFGVLQRGRLMDKGVYPHVLAMTATPIPRTLAITYHGDMDVSILDELPGDRRPVTTEVVGADQLAGAYDAVRRELERGRQAFVVYPVIDGQAPSESNSRSGSADLRSAKAGFVHLRDKVFPEFKLGYLQGRMKGTAKEEVMQAFQAGELQLLVSTTVVEVGIDVPKATIMLVENAERFGLTQLHQLRGRVGRGAWAGRCILVQRGGGEEAARRLGIIARTADGFEIADEDLKLRGPGELFGDQQHGFHRTQLIDLANDGPVIRAARQAAFALIRQDPQLRRPEHRPLKQVLKQRYRQQLDFITLG